MIGLDTFFDEARSDDAQTVGDWASCSATTGSGRLATEAGDAPGPACVSPVTASRARATSCRSESRRPR